MTHGAMALRKAASRRGLNQREVGELLGCSEAFSSLLFNGEREPGRELSVKIEALFGIAPRLWSLSVRDELVGAGVSKAKKTSIHRR